MILGAKERLDRPKIRFKRLGLREFGLIDTGDEPFVKLVFPEKSKPDACLDIAQQIAECSFGSGVDWTLVDETR